MKLICLIPALFLVVGCDQLATKKGDLLNVAFACPGEIKFADHSWLVPFDRDTIEKNLAKKIKLNIPLIVHCLVPLCDNTFQGIIPTTPSLGDGFSITSNLYWATRNGMKRYYANHSDWKEIAIQFQPTDTILERVVFKRKFENGANVILICDAYRGDQMENCLVDYFDYLADKKEDSIFFNNSYLKVGSEADMIVFNGHNGLMDVQIDPVYATKKREKDAVVIACSSRWNYTEYITYTNSYPLVTTTSSLYPGASILNAIIEEWAFLKDPGTIRSAAGSAYHELKNCGAESAADLFYTGW